MVGSRLRLGTVPYLNAKPLTLALEESQAAELIVMPPSQLAGALEANALDGALVSTFAMFQLQGAVYVPGVGITSAGPVESIRLYCRKPVDTLRRVGLDSWSLAAANMTRVLLKRRWGVTPEFVPIDPEAPPRADESLDAFLLIGDNALREPPGDLYVMDLGDEWTAYTKLPFVYALWVFRPGAGDAAASRMLRAAKEEGVSRIGEIIQGAAKSHPWLDTAQVRAYLTACIGYDVGPREEEGLKKYYEWLVEDALVPDIWTRGRLPGGEEREKITVSTPSSLNPEVPAVDESLFYAEAYELSERIRKKELSPVELVDALLARIGAHNDDIFAFNEVAADHARIAARAAGEEIAAGKYRGPLHGIPYGAKDIINTAGIKTTNGSILFKDHVPAEDAVCIARLKAAGAILLGKTNTHEFAAATTTINIHYGTTRNPWNRERIVGGSSGGSAAAIAAGMAPLTLGSDTGGSIRIPSAFCGGGLKPTHGRVSLTGVCPNTLSLDHIGPMTRSARDAGLMLQAIAGYDPKDPHSRKTPVPDYLADIEKGAKGLRVALSPEAWGRSEMDADVAAAFDAAVDVFRGLGAKIEERPFPFYDRIMKVAGPILASEFLEFHRPLYEKHPESYGPEIVNRLGMCFDAKVDDYVRALRERRLLHREVGEWFKDCDVLLTPGVQVTAATIEGLKVMLNGKETDWLWLHRPFSLPHNLTACPALVTPMGLAKDGLPVSLQIVGPKWGEAKVLRAAHAYERATPEIRAKRPPGF